MVIYPTPPTTTAEPCPSRYRSLLFANAAIATQPMLSSDTRDAISNSDASRASSLETAPRLYSSSLLSAISAYHNASRVLDALQAKRFFPPTSSATGAAKRKNADDAALLGNVPKKPRNDPENVPELNLQRKRIEKIGNLVITRKVPSTSQSRDVSQEPQRPPSRATPSGTNGLPPVAGPSKSRSSSKPPSTSSAGMTFARVRKKGKERDVLAGNVAEHEVEEDVRQMNSEADDLRDRSRASIASMTPAAMSIELEFPPSKSGAVGKSRVRHLREQAGAVPTADSTSELSTPSRTGRDGVMPIADQETPQIAKNRLFRGESKPRPEPSTSSGGGSANGEPPRLARRRSSLSLRGKRSSSAFESTGIITLPHTSVSDTSLYKHIDPEQPESERTRQLLIWVSSRAKDPSAHRNRGRKSISNQPSRDSDLPTLPPGGAELLQEIEDELIRQLAEKKIDTSAYSGPSGVNGSWKLKENEQNVKNRAREKLFTEQIEERKKEDLAWAEVAQFYNAHQANVLSGISQKSRASSKAKGKQRAGSQEPESLEPWENELPDVFRGPRGYDLAKHLLEVGVEGIGKPDSRREDLEYKEDRLLAAASVARQFTQIAALDLDRRFSLLSTSLAQRTLPSSTGASLSGQQVLSNFVPATSLPASRNPALDAQDLLRALTRTDAARPRGQLGDAARRAAKDVQRARESQAHQTAEGGIHVLERKLTDVPPPTPRKPPGTPKRSTTPGASRR
ncbi:uncharacterized protein FOMMEDRAFT_165737 [Fomitiporia mediterranea MF3/22]|uniref:uncharacterized protein n=1 Tax=Fomitiporia mediterranea (strain MF3/22) TaxID=694068 RepID=UPI0004407510|nr:uncharacterized protein FOMMEDRAFT_165737 [Fomitiporia mediterranea MF3/22]EJD07140.1 hypothetical protein FOMMEDRAFT_165737 [Fomitiporia mediterranea MF3/22]